jgi:hypothetical protein
MQGTRGIYESLLVNALVAEQVDARVLKTLDQKSYEFESHREH